MDINAFMRKMCVQLGIHSLNLEDQYMNLIKECILTDTIPTFSQYFPYDYTYQLDLSKQRIIRSDPTENSVIYYMRNEEMEANDMDVISVVWVEGSSDYDLLNSAPVVFNIEAMILEGAASSTRSLLNLNTRYSQFLPPNQLKLIGYKGNDKVHVTVKTKYPNFGTIPPSVKDPFERLAKLDIKLWLYPDLKMYDKLDVGDGTVDLKLDGWENAEQERNALLEEFRTKNFGYMAHYQRHQHE